MFFHIGARPHRSFFQHHDLGCCVVSVDPGWQLHDVAGTQVLFKGYVVDATVAEVVAYHARHQQPRWRGNFAVIVIDHAVTVTHDVERSFPLWHDQQAVTNLTGLAQQPVWADHLVTWTDRGVSVEPWTGQDLLPQPTDLEQAVNTVAHVITQQASAESLQALSWRLFVTGGVDTALLHAIGQQVQAPWVVLDHEYVYYDDFVRENWTRLRQQHWAYGQIHHWPKPTVLVTGACGDEFMMRGPSVAGLWAAWHDIDILGLIQPGHYHWHYFQRPANKKILQQAWQQRDQLRRRWPTAKHLHDHLYNVNANDHQHWHLGQTLTWTPLRNRSITQAVLGLDTEILVDQILNAGFTRRVIEHLHAPSLQLIKEHKNV